MAPVSSSNHAWRVLVVDDDERLRRAIRWLLDGDAPGAAIMEASNAVEALGALEAPDAHGFDLVLLDIGMPGMSGLDALKEIRGRLQLTLPVVIMSALPQNPYALAAARAGADAFLRKERIAEELMALLRGLIQLRSANPRAVLG